MGYKFLTTLVLLTGDSAKLMYRQLELFHNALINTPREGKMSQKMMFSGYKLV
jgi:hypothetical protein